MIVTVEIYGGATLTIKANSWEEACLLLVEAGEFGDAFSECGDETVPVLVTVGKKTFNAEVQRDYKYTVRYLP